MAAGSSPSPEGKRSELERGREEEDEGFESEGGVEAVFWCYKGGEGFVWFGEIRVVYDNS